MQQKEMHATLLVSIVVPSVNGLPTLAECVESFAAQASTDVVEIIVVDRCGLETREEIERLFPQVKMIAVDEQVSIPAMRAIGISYASGRMIALTEDHCIAGPDWLKSVESACAEERQAVGGPVENGCVERIVDWAAFYCEYASFMEPVPRGNVPHILGINSVYQHATLELVREELTAGLWEPFWHRRMTELGVVFFSDPDMLVLHKKTFGFTYFLAQRYHFARSFAAMRVANWPWLRRLLYATATAALPAILLKRISITVLEKKQHRVRFIMAFPILCTFLMSWAIGEGIGAILGPGQSLQRVE